LKVKILFVCLGNICRSPAAEGVMNKFIIDNNLESYIQCDSAGTASYHVGSPADSRMKKIASQKGFEILSRARQINDQDLEIFDYIITMDDYNYRDVKSLDKNNLYNDKIFKFKDFCSDPSIREVPDPYYGGEDGFHKVINILEDGCKNLLSKIKKETLI